MIAAGDLLRASVRGRRGELTALAIWSVLEALPAFLMGRLVAKAFDEGFLAGDTGTGMAWLGLLAASVVLGAWATRHVWLRLAAIVEAFRDELATHAVAGALARATTPGAARDGGAVARLTQQVEIVREAYASVLLALQGFVVVTTGAVIGLATLAPVVLAFVLPPLAIALALFAHALRGMARRQRASILAEERVAETGGALVAGVRDVVACGAEDAGAALAAEPIEAQAAATRELARFTAVRTIAVAVGGLVPIVLILAFGAWLMRNGATTGMVLGALTYVAQGIHPALQTLVRGLGGPGLWLGVTLARVAEASSAPARPAQRVPGWARPRHGDLALRGVTFAYGPGADPVIRALDLAVRDGDHLAIVGPSGVGKSTLANLVGGVLHPQAGEVRLGGVRIDSLDPATLADHRVLIPQEAYVFEGTLRENLAYLCRRDGGSALAPDARLDPVVDALGLRSLVARLGGYDAPLDRDGLSAGERQLVTLGRAYLSPAPLVVLDEATCHLDPAAEAVAERAFARRPGTTIVIAHRISSALRARRVLVLDGAAAVVGTHDELVDRSALYRDLVGHWGAPAPVSRAARPAPPAAPGCERRRDAAAARSGA